MKPLEPVSDPSPARRLERRLADAGVTIAPSVSAALIALVDRLAAQKQNLTTITDLDDAVDRHLADSLVALALPEVRAATTIIDVGSGGGFPGIPLAAALPGAIVTLVESEGKKARWLERCVGEFPNLRIVADRSEHLAGARREEWSLATARALASPAVALELTAPLVAVGGHIVLWRTAGADPALDADAAAAAGILGLERMEPHPVAPFPGARRMLDRYAKVLPTPGRFPRRAGRAAKRPLGVGA
ncbi:MAG: 16S rRNA (guanine(527)-N(7))-methyltransferase RsmG [Thermoleophilia bacterium]